MAGYRKSYKQAEPKPILQERKHKSPDGLDVAGAVAVGRIAAAALSAGNAVYLQPSRFGTVTVKVYIEGEQFAENLNPDDDWLALAEAIIEALYDLDTVGKARRLLPHDATSATETPLRKRAGVGTPVAGLP